MDRLPIWSPGGTRIVFDSNRMEPFNLYVKDASGAGTETRLVDSTQANTPTDWSADGRFLLYQSLDPQTGYDLWVRPLMGDEKPWVFVKTTFQEHQGRFSPDGRWVATSQTNRGGTRSMSGRLPPSVVGHRGRVGRLFAEWTVAGFDGGRNLSELSPGWPRAVLLGPGRRAMAASITVRGTAVEPATPAALFPTRIYAAAWTMARVGTMT